MTARQDILAGKFKASPAATTALAQAGGTAGGATAELFANFVGYANATWSYAAQPGAQTAPALLDGDGAKSIACGTIREALKLMLREDLNLTDVKNADINGYFLTRSGLQCFDPKVKGNVGNHGKPTFDLACHFSTHYFLQTGGKFFDPCLMAVYAKEDGPISHRTKVIGSMEGLRKAGTGRALLLLRLLRGRTVPGFGSVWEVLTPAECKTVLSATELQTLKNDQDVKDSKLL
jgi:hypothetical protein